MFSSRLSHYLAHGNISPCFIYREIKRFEKKKFQMNLPNGLYSNYYGESFLNTKVKKNFWKRHKKEDLRQDYKYSSKFSYDKNKFQSWCLGQTNNNFINANMIELNETGYMSNRGRQNVASFLIHHLNQDWRYGADYFASKLYDYDEASNNFN